jgi:hypothetical protein
MMTDQELRELEASIRRRQEAMGGPEGIRRALEAADKEAKRERERQQRPTPKEPRYRGHHECDPLACGIFYDPACPVWGDGSLPWCPETVSEFCATLQSPVYRKRLAKVMVEVLAPEIGKICADLMRRASA